MKRYPAVKHVVACTVLVTGMALGVFAGCSDSGSISEPDGDTATSCEGNDDFPAGQKCNLTTGYCEPTVITDGDTEIVETDDDLDVDKDEVDLPDTPDVDDSEPAEGDVEPEVDEPPADTDGKIIVVQPPQVDFGYVLYGGSNTKDVIIKNADDATANLTVSHISFLSPVEDIDFSLELGTGVILPMELPPGEGFSVSVTYRPTDAVPDEGEQLLISSDDRDNSLVRVDLTPRYKGDAHIGADPESIAFGEVPIGGSDVQTITITNSGDPDGNMVLRISSIALASSGGYVGNDFKLRPSREPTPEQPLFLNPGESLTINVDYSPTQEGSRSDTIYIVTSDGDYPAPGFPIAISGRGIAADMQVLPSPIEFETVRLETREEVQVRIINTGSDVLNISSISLRESSTDFSLDTGGDTQWSLANQEEAIVTVAFEPAAEGEQFDRLVIISDGDVSNYQVPIHGIGGNSTIEVTPTDVDFGNVQVGITGVANVTVVANGALPLNIDRIEMTDSSGYFGFTDNTEYYTPINPGFSRVIEFTFIPQGVNASWTASAKIFSDAGNTESDGSINLSLRASSSDPVLLVVPSTTVEFNPVELYDTDQQEITVKNVGNGSLTIYDIRLAGGSSSSLFITGQPVSFPQVLARNEAIVFNAEFTPVAPGEANGAVIITHNDFDLFEPGDLDRTDYELVLHASGIANHKPVAVLAVNNRTEEPIDITYNSVMILSASGSSDPDSDEITDWDFQIESAPDGHLELAGTGNARTVHGNVSGEWVFSLRVMDARNLWSEKATLRVTVGNPPNRAPTAVIRANGSVDDIQVVQGDEVVLDAIGSSDPDDGDSISDYDYRLEAAPAGAEALAGSGGTRSFVANALGTYTISLKVADSHGSWSTMDRINVLAVAPPDNHMEIVYDDMNWGCYDLAVTPPTAVGGSVCDSAHAPLCDWGPTHSGWPGGGLGNWCSNGCSVDVAWGTQNQDGVYLVTARRSLDGLCLIQANEHTDVTFYQESTPYYRCTIAWGLLSYTAVEFTWERQGGLWRIPLTQNSDVTCVAVE